MRIEFNILWVEDEDSWYETTKDLFSDTLEDLGFKLVPKQCKTFDEVKKEIDRNCLKEYDLLLVDFTLKGSDSGEKIIEFIRNIKDKPILTDVLFYSSAVENVRNSMKELGLEGVYTADRKDVETKFEQVINTLIKKIQEVNTMRGLIMAETSDLDEIMLEITEILLKSDISKEIQAYIEEKIIKTISSISDIANNHELNILEKTSDTRIFTSIHKACVINKLYKSKQIGIKQFYKLYDQEVLSPRNIFAHVKETIIDGEKVLQSKNGKQEVFNEARCIEIRKSLIKYREILEDIKTQLMN
jgi:signal recognition particle GTPase